MIRYDKEYTSDIAYKAKVNTGKARYVQFGVGVGGDVMNIKDRHKIYVQAMAGVGHYMAKKHFHDSRDLSTATTTENDAWGEFVAAQAGYDFHITRMFSIGAFYRFSYAHTSVNDFINSNINLKFSLLFD